jgi:phosphate uptake regulator
MANAMEIRKVQITGGSSFTISLPKDWIRSQAIEKNHPVGINVQQDGTLLVYPNIDNGRIEKVKFFNLDEMDSDITFRILIGAYLMGYSGITIKSPDRIPDELYDTVMDFTQKAIGPEVIEESDRMIIIKDLLNPTKMPFDKTFERMYIMVRYMHSDAIDAVVSGQTSQIEDIESRDLEVDRLNWFLAHQYNIINDSLFSNGPDPSSDDSEFYFVTSKILERIGDHSVIIAKNSKKILEKNSHSRIQEKIHMASDLALELLDRSVNAWFHKDLKAANDTIDGIDPLRRLCEEIDNLSHTDDEEDSLAMGRIVDSIQRTGEYSTDIAENTINYLIDSL